MSHLYCFVFNQDPGRILRSFERGPIGTWRSRRMSQNRKPVRQGQNGQRVNDIICPLDNPIEAIRFTEPMDKFCAGASILGSEEVEIAVEYCGLRHSDLSILNNDWVLSQYPVIPKHEAVGRVVAAGLNRCQSPPLT